MGNNLRLAKAREIEYLFANDLGEKNLILHIQPQVLCLWLFYINLYP